MNPVPVLSHPFRGSGAQELSILTDRLQKVNESLVRNTQARCIFPAKDAGFLHDFFAGSNFLIRDVLYI